MSLGVLGYSLAKELNHVGMVLNVEVAHTVVGSVEKAHSDIGGFGWHIKATCNKIMLMDMFLSLGTARNNDAYDRCDLCVKRTPVGMGLLPIDAAPIFQ